MSVKTLTPVKGEVNKITPFSFEAATAVADGFEFQIPRVATEEYLVIMVQNAGNANATIALKAPEKGSYAAASSDESISLPAGAYAQIRIESARYADTTGIVKLVGSSADVKVAVLC